MIRQISVFTFGPLLQGQHRDAGVHPEKSDKAGEGSGAQVWRYWGGLVLRKAG